ncbi:MAG TPA: hypothetical protein VIH42_03610 [Thermoguttaceae bacterium]
MSKTPGKECGSLPIRTKLSPDEYGTFALAGPKITRKRTACWLPDLHKRRTKQKRNKMGIMSNIDSRDNSYWGFL